MIDKTVASAAEARRRHPRRSVARRRRVRTLGQPHRPHRGSARPGDPRPVGRVEQLRRRRPGGSVSCSGPPHPQDDLVVRRREQGVRTAVPLGRTRARAHPAGPPSPRSSGPAGRDRGLYYRRPVWAPRSPRAACRVATTGQAASRWRRRSRTCARSRRKVSNASSCSKMAITTDFSLVHAYKADRHGNLVFRKAARAFNPSPRVAGRTCIVQVEHSRRTGELDPDAVHLPGCLRAPHRRGRPPTSPSASRSAP